MIGTSVMRELKSRDNLFHKLLDVRIFSSLCVIVSWKGRKHCYLYIFQCYCTKMKFFVKDFSKSTENCRFFKFTVSAILYLLLNEVWLFTFYSFLLPRYSLQTIFFLLFIVKTLATCCKIHPLLVIKKRIEKMITIDKFSETKYRISFKRQ